MSTYERIHNTADHLCRQRSLLFLNRVHLNEASLARGQSREFHNMAGRTRRAPDPIYRSPKRPCLRDTDTGEVALHPVNVRGYRDPERVLRWEAIRPPHEHSAIRGQLLAENVAGPSGVSREEVFEPDGESCVYGVFILSSTTRHRGLLIGARSIRCRI